MIQVIKDKVLLDITRRRDRQKLYQGDPELTERVRTIIDDVARRGLPALLSHIHAFDSPAIKVENLWVTPQEIDAAHAALDSGDDARERPGAHGGVAAGEVGGRSASMITAQRGMLQAAAGGRRPQA